MVIRSKIRAKLHAYKRNKEGAAAIEFAFIAPIMIAFYFGLAEISMAISTDRNVAHATSVAGDLATQSSSLNDGQIKDIMLATLSVLGVSEQELEAGDVTIELNSYKREADTTVTHVGYARLGNEISAGGAAAFDTSNLGNNMLSTTSGVVVARINYKYKPITASFMSEVTMHETFSLKPRKSLLVPFGTSPNMSLICDHTQGFAFTCTPGTTVPS